MSHPEAVDAAGEPIPHDGMSDADFDAMWAALPDANARLAKIAELRSIASGPTTGGDVFVYGTPRTGKQSRQEALDFGKDNKIPNPEAVLIKNEWFTVDPRVPVPLEGWKNKQEAIDYAISIGRPDLVASFDEASQLIRLKEPIQKGIVAASFSEGLGQWILTMGDGSTIFKDPSEKVDGVPPRGMKPIVGTDSVMIDDGMGGVHFLKKSEALSPTFQLGNILESNKRGGFQFIETSPGNFQPLPEAQQPGDIVTLSDGSKALRQPNGTLQLIPEEQPQTLEQLRASALGSGDVDRALAYDDFINRPTSMEAFNAAMQYAQSPGDTVAISNIARGQTLVSPPPAGEVQRIAEQPQFLKDAYERLQRNIKGGTASPNDFMSILNSMASSENQAQTDRAKAETELQQRRDKELQDQSDAADQRFAEKIAREKYGVDPLTGLPPVEGNTPLTNPTPAQSIQEMVQDMIDNGLTELPPVEGTTPLNNPTPAQSIQQQAQDMIDSGLFKLLPEGNNDNTQVDNQEGVSDTAEVSQSTPRAGNLLLNQTEESDTSEVSQLTPRAGDLLLNQTEEDDAFAQGGVFDDRTALVGEEGPEIVVLPVGTKVLSNSDSKKVDGTADLKARLRGVKKNKTPAKGLRNTLKMQEGGTVAPLLPFGVRQSLLGGVIQPTRRRLSRAAGIPILSAQEQQNLLPEELDVRNRLVAEAGIRPEAFAQEQASALPGRLLTRPSRFAARIAR